VTAVERLDAADRAVARAMVALDAALAEYHAACAGMNS